MDPRVAEHARLLVDHCIDVRAGDEVLVVAPPAAEDLVVALNERLGARGAFPVPIYGLRESRENRAFMRAMDPDDYEAQPETLLAVAEHVDAAVAVQAAVNTHETSDVSPETTARFTELLKPFRDEIMDGRWVGTHHPTTGYAQKAEMSTEAYAAFVYEAINRDWEAQRAFQSDLVDILDDGSSVRVVSGETTDVRMSIDGMIAQNDYAETNLPGGEVFTAPVPETVDGEILFDKPVLWRGTEIADVRLVFEDGVVVDHSAGKNEAMLAAMLDTDDGARRLGEIGFGMNREITRFTRNILFDEKMGDTVHFALGMAYDETVGPNREGNDSALHMDMIVDMAADSFVEVDGEVVQRDGRFVFEDGFED